MAQQILVELCLSAAARPHSRCLLRAQNFQHHCRRFTSTRSQSQASPGSRSPAPAPKSIPARPVPPPSKISLHVGLDRNPENLSAISRIPIPKGQRGENFTPSVLARPLGLQHPPRPGQNSPIDSRSWQEKKEDFTSYDKTLERRRIYLRSFFRPYFQEWRRVDYWKGKSFVSNDRLFKREKALYFPNIWGQTLSESDGSGGSDSGKDTTETLMGKISIVGIQSGQWAEEQVDTFIGSKENPQLSSIIESGAGRVQRVDINIQGDWFRAMLVKMFRSRLRQMIPKERWDRYFMVKLPRDVRRGLTEDVRDAMGLLNSQVGYVYLLDPGCRIRWAGSGHAWKGEVEGLNGAIKRLIQEDAAPQAQSQAKTASIRQNPSRNPKTEAANNHLHFPATA